MGLFKNNKKPCPICGNPTPRLFPVEIEGTPICKTCKDKIDLPNGAEDLATLEDFRQYLAAFEENAALQSAFHSTYHHSFGLSGSLLLDESNGLLRLKNYGWVIEKKYLTSFRILEDERPLFESGDGALHIYPSDIPARVQDLVPIIAQFLQERDAYERRTEREDALRYGKETEDERMERQRIDRIYRPCFQDPGLLGGFRVELMLDHPYWSYVENTLSAPSFSDSHPNAEDYMRRYEEQVTGLYTLATKLMQMIDPAAGETLITSEVISADTTSASADVADETRACKQLLEQGLITEEEFTLKKRSLLGI